MDKISALYGAVAGDIIGSVYERHNVKSKKFPLFRESSRFTDDSVMTVATADALLHGLDYAESYRKWGRLFPHAGYGGRFRQWLREEDPRPYNSWGNGSAMRVSPVGFFGNSPEEVLREAERSAAVTHDHPEGIRGAQAAALAVFMARQGETKDAIKRTMEERFSYDLSSRTLDDLRPGYTFDVSCAGTLPAALLAFLESDGYVDAVRNAVSLGGDSDTIAAVTGGIALAYYREMPRSIAEKIREILPGSMADICDEFARVCTFEGRFSSEDETAGRPADPAPETGKAADSLRKFREAHAEMFETALGEIRGGRKQTHWMWFIFPQIAGLGRSPTSAFYAMKDTKEARLYMDDAVLGSNMRRITSALLDLKTDDIQAVFGGIDSLKLRSSMTLFFRASGEEIFKRVIDRFYGGAEDPATLRILAKDER